MTSDASCDSTSFPGSFLYFLEVEKGPWERGWLRLHFQTFANAIDSCASGIALVGFVLRFFEVTWEAARVLYCINFVIFSLRLFRLYLVSGYLGPKVVMIKRMVTCLSFGIFLYASPMSWNQRGSFSISEVSSATFNLRNRLPKDPSFFCFYS